MTAPAPTNYGNSQDWSQIIQGIGSGAQSAMQGASQYANSRKEAREAKRRTLANMLSQQMKRKQAMSRMGQDYSDEMNDFQTQAMQNVARGFVEALHGSTGGY